MTIERRLHLTAWALVVLGALVALHFHDASVRADERARVTADSLKQAGAKLDTATAAAQAAITAQRQREAQVQRERAVRDSALRALAGRPEALARLLRDSLGAAQQAQLDSVEALHARREALLQASADSGWALFHAAAAQRDTLANLLAASQAQAHGLAAALVQARRTPLLERTPFKVVELGLALYGGAKLLGR